MTTTDDTKTLTHLPADAAAEEIHETLERDGALVIDDLVDVELVDRIADEMAPYI